MFPSTRSFTASGPSTATLHACLIVPAASPAVVHLSLCSGKAMILRPRPAATRYKSEHILGLHMHLLLAALWNVVLQFTFVKTQFSHAECLEEFTWVCSCGSLHFYGRS